jgi:hypothetical protein
MADRDIDLRLDDAETVEGTAGTEGPPVDPPVRPATFSDIVSRADERRPIVPASLRKPGRPARPGGAPGRHRHSWLLFHAWKSPKYAAKLACSRRGVR